MHKGHVVNAEFLKEPIKCRGLTEQSNELQSCLLHCHADILENSKQFQGQDVWVSCGHLRINSDLERHLLAPACGSWKESSFSLYYSLHLPEVVP